MALLTGVHNSPTFAKHSVSEHETRDRGRPRSLGPRPANFLLPQLRMGPQDRMGLSPVESGALGGGHCSVFPWSLPLYFFLQN